MFSFSLFKVSIRMDESFAPVVCGVWTSCPQLVKVVPLAIARSEGQVYGSCFNASFTLSSFGMFDQSFQAKNTTRNFPQKLIHQKTRSCWPVGAGSLLLARRPEHLPQESFPPASSGNKICSFPVFTKKKSLLILKNFNSYNSRLTLH